MAAIKDAQALLDKLRAAYGKGDFAGAKATYDQLKVRDIVSREQTDSSRARLPLAHSRAPHPRHTHNNNNNKQLKLILLPALPPTFERTPTAQQELLIGREALELATMTALRSLPAASAAEHHLDADELAATPEQRSLERLLAQLRAFYADTQPLVAQQVIPASQQEAALTGAALLRLLVLGRRADFHCALERLTPAQLADPAVAPAVQIERWLTEGAYNKVLEASAAVSKAQPPPLGAAFLGRLAATVRDEVASCAEAAYGSLPLADAARMMGVSLAEAKAYAARRPGWTVDGSGVVRFSGSGGGGGGGGGGGDAMEADDGGAGGEGEGALGKGCGDSLAFIRCQLQYAKELERIV
jgi:26S proteasome regulatory subunit N12